MKVTKGNLNGVLLENQDARLLIVDAVTHTSADLYYYHDTETTIQEALDIWHKTQAAGREEDEFYSVSFLDFSKGCILPSSGLQQAFSQWYFQGGYLKGLAFGGIRRIW